MFYLKPFQAPTIHTTPWFDEEDFDEEFEMKDITTKTIKTNQL